MIPLRRTGRSAWTPELGTAGSAVVRSPSRVPTRPPSPSRVLPWRALQGGGVPLPDRASPQAPGLDTFRAAEFEKPVREVEIQGGRDQPVFRAIRYNSRSRLDRSRRSSGRVGAVHFRVGAYRATQKSPFRAAGKVTLDSLRHILYCSLPQRNSPRRCMPKHSKILPVDSDGQPLQQKYDPSDFIVAPSDSKGISYRLYVRVAPDLERAVMEVLSSNRFPFRTEQDILRRCIREGVRALEQMEP